MYKAKEKNDYLLICHFIIEIYNKLLASKQKVRLDNLFSPTTNHFCSLVQFSLT